MLSLLMADMPLARRSKSLQNKCVSAVLLKLACGDFGLNGLMSSANRRSIIPETAWVSRDGGVFISRGRHSGLRG